MPTSGPGSRANSSRPRLAAVFGDAAGGAAALPVLALMAAEGRVEPVPLAYDEAAALWARRGQAFRPLAPDLDPAAARALLVELGAGALLAGASARPPEMNLVAAAGGLGLPSLAFLDCWRHYRKRFVDAADRLAFLPTRIAVIDELARAGALAAGLPAERLVVTGLPSLDELAAYDGAAGLAARQRVRARLGLTPDDLLVLFASQPFSAQFGHDRANPGHQGFTEQEVLGLLLDALSAAAPRLGRPLTLLVRPHPRDLPGGFAGLAAPGLRVIVDAADPHREAILAADLVAGMNSILLLESCYLGRVTLSLQPGLQVPDSLPTNAAGLTLAAYRAEEVGQVVERALFDPADRAQRLRALAGLKPGGSAARRLADQVYALMGLA